MLRCDVSVLVCLSAFGISAATCDDTVTLDEIRGAWSLREKSVQTVHIAWKENCMRREVAGEAVSPFESRSPSDPKMKEFECQANKSVWLDGAKFRIQDNEPAYLIHRGTMDATTVAVAFDGTRWQEMNTDGKSRTIAYESSAPPRRAYSMTELRPVVRHFRPSRWVTDPLKDMKVVNKSVPYSGRDCVVLTGNTSDGRVLHSRELWLAPAQGFAIVRQIDSEAGKVRQEEQVEYRHIVNGTWVPNSWKSMQFKDGMVVNARSASVTDIELGDPIDPTVFTITYPVGTRVVKGLTGEPKYYFVEDKNNLRPVAKFEFQSARPNSWSTIRWIGIGIVATSAILGIAIVVCFIRSRNGVA